MPGLSPGMALLQRRGRLPPTARAAAQLFLRADGWRLFHLPNYPPNFYTSTARISYHPTPAALVVIRATPTRRGRARTDIHALARHHPHHLPLHHAHRTGETACLYPLYVNILHCAFRRFRRNISLISGGHLLCLRCIYWCEHIWFVAGYSRLFGLGVTANLSTCAAIKQNRSERYRSGQPPPIPARIFVLRAGRRGGTWRCLPGPSTAALPATPGKDLGKQGRAGRDGEHCGRLAACAHARRNARVPHCKRWWTCDLAVHCLPPRHHHHYRATACRACHHTQLNTA